MALRNEDVSDTVKDDRIDRGEPMAGLRRLETPRDEAVEGVPAHDPVEVAANPLVKTLDVSPSRKM